MRRPRFVDWLLAPIEAPDEPLVRRCPGCYFPMKISFIADWYECELCKAHVTRQELFDRPRWRRALDRVTGMTF